MFYVFSAMFITGLSYSRHTVATLKQLGQPEILKTNWGEFQNNFSTMRHNLTGNVNELSANGVGICTHGNHRSADVFFERFEQKMTDQHRIIPCRIWGKSLKCQLFMAEVFQGTIGQLVTVAMIGMFVSTAKNGICNRRRNRYALVQAKALKKRFILWEETICFISVSMLPA